MATQKWVSLSTSVSPEQKQLLKQKAEASGMSVNEYIKVRLFVDETEEINKMSNLDKWMVKVLAYMNVHIEELARKSLTLDEIKQLEPKTVDIIRRSGFIKDHEILKNKNQSDEV